MTKALTKYRGSSLATPSAGTLILIIILAFIIWQVMKNRQTVGSYRNAEAWEISYNSDGMPTRVIIHRDAKRT